MLEINQYTLYPGVYEHYKGGLYKLETVVTHVQVDNIWTELADPWVVYKNLDNQYKVNAAGNKVWIIKNFMRHLSEFTTEVTWPDGKKYPRFKLV